MTARLIPTQETLVVEFKSDRDKLDDSELIEALIGLANARGGALYLGVENDGTVTGLHPARPQDVQPLAALVANRTAPALSVEVDVIVQDGYRVALIRVPQVSAITARSDGLVKRRRIGGNGQPECVPFCLMNTRAVKRIFNSSTCHPSGWQAQYLTTLMCCSASGYGASSIPIRAVINHSSA